MMFPEGIQIAAPDLPDQVEERKTETMSDAERTPVSPGPTTPSIQTRQPADAPMGEPGKNEEERLDEALQESMTTSDPVSIKIA
ncbi:MAG: hypothetical protein H7Z40_07895 [Phycisphaerae bacterium]|nr:hypothetical protein [Gemmatimonadaceae bacterium]